MDTLEDWLTAMVEHNPNKRITLKTSMLLNEILSGNKQKMNLVVFDNAGGMPFTIWDFKSEKDIRGFMTLDTICEDLLFGFVINGEPILCEHQKKHPHRDLPQERN